MNWITIHLKLNLKIIIGDSTKHRTCQAFLTHKIPPNHLQRKTSEVVVELWYAELYPSRILKQIKISRIPRKPNMEPEKWFPFWKRTYQNDFQWNLKMISWKTNSWSDDRLRFVLFQGSQNQLPQFYWGRECPWCDLLGDESECMSREGGGKFSSWQIPGAFFWVAIHRSKAWY